MAATRRKSKAPARVCRDEAGKRNRTRAGKPCRGNPLHGHPFCMAHAPESIRESVGFIAKNGKQGRPANPRVVDVLRERVEERIDEVLAPLFEGLSATRGIALSIRGGGMEIAHVPDHQVRLAAVRELLDRAYGKPRQAIEHSGTPPAMPEGQIIAELAGLDDGTGSLMARVGVAFGPGAGAGPTTVEGQARERH